MQRLSLLLLLLLAAHSSPAKKLYQKDLRRLARTMAGAYSSEAQHKADTSYYHIKLRMKPIWKERRDGYWLYVEQSLADMQDKPYRQRVYHLYLEDDSTIVSKVYEMKHPAQYTGGWQQPEKLAPLAFDSLVDRQGCGIFLHRNKEGNYAGSTPGKQCLSSLRGATYATSQVTIYKDRLESWDRGWDATDKQMWGAVKGGYSFVKEQPLK